MNKYERFVKANKTIDELIKLLIERDGGDHDNDCKIYRVDGQCNCGHDAVNKYLKALKNNF